MPYLVVANVRITGGRRDIAVTGIDRLTEFASAL